MELLRGERTLQYEDERAALDDQYDALLGIAEQGQRDILDAEEAWWADRLALASGASGGADGRTGGDHAREIVPIPLSELPSFGPGIPASQVAGAGGVTIENVQITVTEAGSAAETAEEVVRQFRLFFEAL
jgi:hypothetical protein